MVDHAHPQIYAQKIAEPRLNENIENLFVGRMMEAEGSIQVGQQKPYPASFKGQLVFYGRTENNKVVLERLGRVAIYGWLNNPDESDGIGTLSLVGPLREIAVDPEKPNLITDIPLEIHYRRLSQFTDSDAVFPSVEEVSASLGWAYSDQAGQGEIELDINLEAIRSLAEKRWGAVRKVRLTSTAVVTFYRTSRQGSIGPPRNSLRSHCGPPLPCPPGVRTIERRIPLKFVSFSQRNPAEVEAVCNSLIDGVCQVWRNKAALEVIVWPNLLTSGGFIAAQLDDGNNSEKDKFRRPNSSERKTIAQTAHDSRDHICIYVVDRLPPAFGGGITIDCGKPSTYCILDVNRAENNRFLLAHELGHALGIDHPGRGNYSGDVGSVMEPQDPNFAANTLHNCLFLTTDLLNPIVELTNGEDCFHND